MNQSRRCAVASFGAVDLTSCLVCRTYDSLASASQWRHWLYAIFLADMMVLRRMQLVRKPGGILGLERR